MDNDQLKVTLQMLDIEYSSIREKDNSTCLYINITEFNDDDLINLLRNVLKDNNFQFADVRFENETEVIALYIYLK
jgi:hypothetical protein